MFTYKAIDLNITKDDIDLITKERDSFKTQADQWNSYQTNKRESLMSKLTEEDDKSIADGLSLDKLEQYVVKVTNVNAPSTSSARATTGKAGEMGGYGSPEEFATKDPDGFTKHLQENLKGYIK